MIAPITNAVDAFSPTTGAAAYTKSSTGSTGSTAKSGNDAMGKDMFLKLLVAQLKYQDPMKPTNGTEFIQQTSQLSMVEKLDAILTATNANAVSSASVAATGLVGRTIQYKKADGTAVTGPVGAVRLDRTGPVLVVGTDEVALANVLQVLATPTTTTPATPTTPTTTTTTTTTTTPPLTRAS